MRIFENKILILILRLILGGLFIYASWSKLLNPEDFGRAIRGYDMMPLGIISILSVFLPYMEFFSGLFLIFGIFKRGSVFIVIALLVIFLIGLTQAYARGLSIDCGCFSVISTSENQGGSYLLIRIIEDIFMLLTAFLIYNFERKKLIKVTNNKI